MKLNIHKDILKESCSFITINISKFNNGSFIPEQYKSNQILDVY